jgi:hypothetical protein
MARRIEYVVSLPGVATITVPVFVAEQDTYIIAADWAHQGAVDGTKTVQLKDNTGNFNITAALTINGVAALTKTPFVMASTNAPIKKGDVVVCIYTCTVAGAVGAGESTISTQQQDAVGIGAGPGWAG